MIKTQFTEFDSSTVNSAQYDAESQKMIVTFKGAAYEYDEVDMETYLEFISAKSHGKALNTLIKGKFAYSKIEEVEKTKEA